MYKDKVVLITGASRGIGKMLAEYFLFQKARVIGISKESQPEYDNYFHYQIDLSNPVETVAKLSMMKKEFTNIDILINNAAVLTSQYLMKMKVEDAISMVVVDLLAPFIVVKECSKIMNSGGRIVNISSMAVPLEPMGDSMYAACKAGLEKMSNIAAKEFAMFGITVNTLGVSAIGTDMLRQLNMEKVDKVVKSLPIPRYAIPEDIINVVDFFCSEMSSYITAQTIYLGGVHN